MKSKEEIVLGEWFLEIMSEEEIVAAMEEHAATRTAEIEAIEQDLIDSYGLILGESVLAAVYNYREGTTLEMLLDYLDSEVRSLMK